jgi:hypothetical protein
MDISYDLLTEKYPGATLTFRVEKFDQFLHHMQKLVRDEFEREQKAIRSNNEETFYSFKHVANMLDISTRTLNRWQAQGYLVPVMIGGQRRYRRSDIEKIINREANS